MSCSATPSKREHERGQQAGPVLAGSAVDHQRGALPIGDDLQCQPDLSYPVDCHLGVPVGQESHGVDDVAERGLVVGPVLDAAVVIRQPEVRRHPAASLDLPGMAQVDHSVHAERRKPVQVCPASFPSESDRYSRPHRTCRPAAAG